MKRYNRNGQLDTVICNCCGKKLIVDQGILREAASALTTPGIFSPRRTGKSTILTCARAATTS